MRSAIRVCAEVLAEAFDLHGRMLRTLVPLLFRPGHLSCEFSNGRRAAYVSPGRLYLFVSVVFFFVLSVFGDTRIDANDLSEARESAVNDPELRRNLERMPEKDRERIRTLLESHGVDPEPLLGPTGTHSGAATDPDVDSPAAAVLRDATLTFLENPETLFHDLIGNLPIGMFVMLPLFGLLLKAFYPRRFYAEHLVFALHLHAFLFLAFTLIVLTPEAPPAWGWLDAAVNTACAAYVFLALRHFYRQSVGVTLAKGIVLSALYFVALSVGILAVFVVTVLVR